MTREILLELLAASVRRPATQCLRRTPTQPLAPHCRRISLPATSTHSKSAPNPSNSTASASSKPSSNPSDIPLHIGIDRNPENLSAISRIPIPRGVKGEEFRPAVLSRPIGLPFPPQPGQNSPVSDGTRVPADYAKVLEDRRMLMRSYFRPYYQEWSRMAQFKGKSFIASERLFREDKALYFPNMWGQTLATEGDEQHGGRDTTPVMQGKTTVVGIQCGQWAENQVKSFLGKEANPELQKILAESGGLAQRIDINAQSGWAQAMLVRLFKGRIRGMLPEEQWHRYFLIRLARDVKKGLSEQVRDAMGFLNSQVGYVYLLDPQCRIRWAGSGDAWDGEIASLNAGVSKLIGQAQDKKSIGAMQRTRPGTASA